MLVACWGSVGEVKELLARGADINVRDLQGRTPLIWVGRSADAGAIIDELVAAGANVHAVSKGGTTPLINAVEGDSRDAVRALLLHGANPSAPDAAGRTPLMMSDGPMNP
jgi:ankyrin repeat protein